MVKVNANRKKKNEWGRNLWLLNQREKKPRKFSYTWDQADDAEQPH